MINLTATELPRFVGCNGSRLLEKIPEFNKDSTLRDEGDAAHWLSETVFKGEHTAKELIDRKAPNGFYIDADMVENCEPYITGSDGQGSVEVDTSYSGETWSVAGRADRLAPMDGFLFVDDFKYGWKIVEPKENWTLISHALGWVFANPELAETIHTIVFRIFQPRPYHPEGSIRQWRITRHDLMEIYWVKLSAALHNPTDVLNTSLNCYRCASYSLCPAAQTFDMTAIEISQGAFNSKMSPKERSFMLDQMRRAEKAIKESLRAHEDAALHEAKAGVKIPNYSIEATMSTEQWQEGVSAEMLKLITGVDFSKDAVITPGQAKKKIVASLFDDEKLTPNQVKEKVANTKETLKSFYGRKTTGARLVRVSDSEQAAKMFGKK